MKVPSISVENACVVVLGDIGRSPRMQYHVKSLAETRYFVDFIGYVESKPLEDLTSNPNVRIHALNPFPELQLPGILRYIFKSCWQALTLLMALISIHKPKFILCQNPPAIPTLVVVYLYCLLSRTTKMIIDWHNYTHTIMAMTSSSRSPIVKFAKSIEYYFGRKACENLCVTKAMKQDLQNNQNIHATVLYDRAPLQFHPISIEERHDLFMKLSKLISEFAGTVSENENPLDASEISAFTIKLSNGEIQYRHNRPALLISSTSWTPDEDFGILLLALDIYETKAIADPFNYPQLICVITGKGPQKSYYKSIVSQRCWTKVVVVTPWLENADYPKLLAAGDLGVCLHYSSSGLDLPMKVVDMFGSGLPVCAINFKCIEELVQHGENGFIFNTPEELANQICNWFQHFPVNVAMTNQKGRINQCLKKFQQLRWDENWNRNVTPLLERL